jgi:hypothetical protein
MFGNTHLEFDTCPTTKLRCENSPGQRFSATKSRYDHGRSFGASQPGGLAGFGYRASEPLRERNCIRRGSAGSLLRIILHRVVVRNYCGIVIAHHKASLENCSECVAGRALLIQKSPKQRCQNSCTIHIRFMKSCLGVLETARGYLGIRVAVFVGRKCFSDSSSKSRGTADFGVNR